MWPNPQDTADLVTYTEEILNGKLHFLCSVTLILLDTEKYSLVVSLLFLVTSPQILNLQS